MKHRVNPIVGFMLKFVVLYGSLMILWPVVYGPYCAFFRGVGDLAFRTFWSTDVIRFEGFPYEERKGENDTRVEVHRKRSPRAKGRNICARDVAYLSTAVFTTLVLASPISWRRRGRAFLVGACLLHVFIVLRLTILIAAMSSGNTPDPWLAHDSFWTRAVWAAIWRLSLGQPVGYIAAVLIWVLVSLRREDLELFISGKRAMPILALEGTRKQSL